MASESPHVCAALQGGHVVGAEGGSRGAAPGSHTPPDHCRGAAGAHPLPLPWRCGGQEGRDGNRGRRVAGWGC